MLFKFQLIYKIYKNKISIIELTINHWIQINYLIINYQILVTKLDKIQSNL
jgi:hypothetical protein